MSGKWLNKLAGLCCGLIFSHATYAVTNLVPIPVVQGAADGLLVKFRVNTSKSSQLHALSASGLRVVERFTLVPGLTHVSPVAGENLQSTLSSIKSDPNVEYAEPNYLVSIEQLPNDPQFNSQYGLYNTGQTGGVTGADINAKDVWDIATGTDVVVAVIDSGVEYTHSDLQMNMWKNPGEIEANNIDDDNNGFIDDIYGWNFSSDDSDPMDDLGHGTHVAGIVAAKGNNGVGIAGINWSAKIMALKFIDVNGIGSTANAIKALNYAVAMGARVSNNSWGGGGFSQALYDAIAASEQAEHIFVAAAGNKGINTDDPINAMHYPSSYPMDNVISTAATDESDMLGTFSNLGPVSVDLAAPGRQINSLWINDGYLSLDGTSMAAPFVTGAVALLLSKDSSLSVAQIRSAILDNVDPLPSLLDATVTGGRLNLFKAVNSISRNINITPLTNYLAINEPYRFEVSGGTPPYTWSVNDENVATINSASGVLTGKSAGVTRITVIDSAGITSSSDNIFIENIQMQPELAFLNVGDQLQFSAVGGVAPYTWSTTNSLVAQIDTNTGLLTAIGAGQTTLAVKDAQNVSVKSTLVDVVFIPDLSIQPQSLTLIVGEQYQFNAAGGAPPYKWQLNDPAIAQIDTDSGMFTAVSPGVVQVELTDANGTAISSNDIIIEGMSIVVPNVSMRINETQRLTVTGGVSPFEWFVSNSLVAEIDPLGNLVALSPGSVKVSLLDANGSLAYSEMILITNSNALSLAMPASILSVDEVVNVNVVGGILPYRWISSNPSVLEINEAENKVRAIGPGVGYITIKDAVGEVVSSAIVEVRSITVISQRSTYLSGDTEQFFASGGAAPYSWQVDNANIATINANGFFQAKSPGLVNIGITDSDGIRGETKILTVSNSFNDQHSMVISPNSATFSKRSVTTIQFVASGGVEPYRFALSKPFGNINSLTGEFSSNSPLAGQTTVIVTDGDGHLIESGIIEIK